MVAPEGIVGAGDGHAVTANDHRIRQGLLNAYVALNGRIWRHLPASIRRLPPGEFYGRHLHWLARSCSSRKQYVGTFFLRNRPELELMARIVGQLGAGSRVEVAVLACSKGAEVYSIAWALRSAHPGLKLAIQAVDISQDILEFAKRGLYSLRSPDELRAPDGSDVAVEDGVARSTCQDQNAPIFERMTRAEMEAMCEVDGERVRIKPWLREGISWLRGDAGERGLVDLLGAQDIVVANRFLCHMEPAAAEGCLRNVGRLVKPGGYLFVSGVDLDIRTRVALDEGWWPVPELRREVYEGDASLSNGWPLEYWGLEPYRGDRTGEVLRYTSVFQVGRDKRAAT